ncbi:MAG: CpaF family protein, partial [Proteobacteria bacterium]|nr:CpaF family protein [Pseudomonadota bacterium]
MSDFFAAATTEFLKPISSLLEDEGISEIMVNGYNEIFAEKKGKIFKTKLAFEDEEQLMAAVRRIAQAVGKTVDEENPILDGRLPDGSRVNAVLSPVARKGIYVSIRKFMNDSLSVKQLVQFGAMSIEMAKFLNLCSAMAKNTI